MYTHKDLEIRTIFIINCIDHEKGLRVSNGELLLEEPNEEKKKVLTKFPFQKILALFIVGHITITTPLLEKCKKYNVPLVVMKPNLRPVFYWGDTAEANYLLRQRQHSFDKSDISIARILVYNKIQNQLIALKKTRKKDVLTINAIEHCEAALNTLQDVVDYNILMGVEGMTSKIFFSAYYQNLQWKGRRPRTKCDILNTTLDIGYTILFNYIECFARMFGFDLYVGVYHRLWFKRKSLICDLMEPFRCVIDHSILLAFNRKQFRVEDFELIKSEYHLKHNKSFDYYHVFYDALLTRKMEVFHYIQAYYRCFMGCKSIVNYPNFVFK